MAQLHGNPERRAAASIWTLRVAGPQDDSNPKLWAEHTRSTGHGPAELAGLISRCRWLILAVFLAVFVPAAAWLLMASPMYEASLRLFLRSERPGAGVAAQPVGPVEMMPEIEIIRSRELLRKVAQKYELSRWVRNGAADEKLEQAVTKLEQQVRVGAAPESSLISIEYDDADPKVAAGVVNTLAALYLEQHAASRREAEVEEPSGTESEIYEQELQAAQAALADFRERNPAPQLETRRKTALARVMQLEADKASLDTRIRQAQARLSVMKRQGDQRKDSPSRSGANEPLTQELTTLLADLQRQRTELLGRYEPTHRLVGEVDQMIADTQTALQRAQSKTDAEPAQAASLLRQSIDAEYLRTQAEIAGLQAGRIATESELSEAEGWQSQLERMAARDGALERSVQMATENYQRYLDRVKAARIASALDAKPLLSVSVLEEATPPALPANRRQTTLLLLSLLAAASAAMGAAALYDPYRKPCAYVAEIATATGAPVLMMIEETQSHVS